MPEDDGEGRLLGAVDVRGATLDLVADALTGLGLDVAAVPVEDPEDDDGLGLRTCAVPADRVAAIHGSLSALMPSLDPEAPWEVLLDAFEEAEWLGVAAAVALG